MNVYDLPLISRLETALLDELDRQYLNGDIEPSSDGQDGFFDPVDGELNGRADWHAACAAVFNALKEEGVF